MYHLITFLKISLSICWIAASTSVTLPWYILMYFLIFPFFIFSTKMSFLFRNRMKFVFWRNSDWTICLKRFLASNNRFVVPSSSRIWSYSEIAAKINFKQLLELDISKTYLEILLQSRQRRHESNSCVLLADLQHLSTWKLNWKMKVTLVNGKLIINYIVVFFQFFGSLCHRTCSQQFLLFVFGTSGYPMMWR